MILYRRLKFSPLNFFIISLILLMMWGCAEKRFQEKKIQYLFRTAQNVSDIEKAYDSLYVRPIIYRNIVPLKQLTVQKRKQLFVDMLLPVIVSVRYELEQQLNKVIFLENLMNEGKSLDTTDIAFLNNLRTQYLAKDIVDLKKRIKPHPISLVLAQAAIESGWGTSRFCSEANNLFGVWSYSPSKGIKSLYNRGDKEIYVRQYENIQESVRHYFLTLSRVRAYAKFREARWLGANSLELINLLGAYSENAEKYSKDLQIVINKNKFTQYDHLQLEATALVAKQE